MGQKMPELRIAIVSDERDGLAALQTLGNAHQLSHYTWQDSQLAALAASRPSVVICDVHSSPFPSEAFQRLRRLVRVPILVLGQSGEKDAAVKALKQGADDWVGPPWWEAEIQARVEALARRYWEWRTESPLADEPELVFDRSTRSVSVSGRTVKLTHAEYRLLDCLSERPGEVVSREDLARCLWGEREAEQNVAQVSLYVHQLRRKLERDPHCPRFVRTRRGGGYYLSQESG